MTRHILDRPIWSMLVGPQAFLSVGDGHARRYFDDVSPFAAAADDSPESLSGLAGIASSDASLVLLQTGEIVLPPGLERIKRAKGVQMIALEPVDPVACDFRMSNSRKRTPGRWLRH